MTLSIKSINMHVLGIEKHYLGVSPRKHGDVRAYKRAHNTYATRASNVRYLGNSQSLIYNTNQAVV